MHQGGDSAQEGIQRGLHVRVRHPTHPPSSCARQLASSPRLGPRWPVRSSSYRHRPPQGAQAASFVHPSCIALIVWQLACSSSSNTRPCHHSPRGMPINGPKCSCTCAAADLAHYALQDRATRYSLRRAHRVVAFVVGTACSGRDHVKTEGDVACTRPCADLSTRSCCKPAGPSSCNETATSPVLTRGTLGG